MMIWSVSKGRVYDDDGNALSARDVVGEVQRLQGRIRGAEHLAYHCAEAIARGDIRTRTAVDDALLEFMEVGSVGGPPDVSAWVAEYRARNAASGCSVGREGE